MMYMGDYPPKRDALVTAHQILAAAVSSETEIKDETWCQVIKQCSGCTSTKKCVFYF
jgi:hypothetical protein